MSQTVIIGGGVAGLMAALHLAERGVPVTLLEADATWIGGRLRDGPAVTFEYNGQRWVFPSEHGFHGIWSPYRNLKAALARFNIHPPLLASREETWVFAHAGRVRKAPAGSAIRSGPIPAPFHYIHLFARPRFLAMLTVHDLASILRVIATLFTALAVDPLAEQKALTGTTLADLTRGWSPALRGFFVGLARNGLAAHPEDVPASGFIAFLRFYTLLRRDSWAFDYLGGTGGACISQPLTEAAHQRGAVVRLGASVTQLEHEANRWLVRYKAAEGASQTMEAERVILAVDAPAAESLLRNSPATAAAAATLRFPVGVPTAIFRLWFSAAPQRSSESGIFSGDFILDNFLWLHMLQPAYQEWHQATGGSAIEMHIYGPPEVLAQPDAALLAQAITDTYRAFPELTGTLVHTTLTRNLPTHTLFSVGAPGTHVGIETPWPELWACGDWVYHPAPALYLERATLTGIAAANAVLSSMKLEPWPLLPSPRPSG